MLSFGFCAVSLFCLAPLTAAEEGKGADPGKLIYPEAMRLGREASSAKRYQAAFLYFSAALSENPNSNEARTAAAEALHFSRRFPPKEDDLTEFERGLPSAPPELLNQIEEEVRKKFTTEGGQKEPDMPVPEDKPGEEEPTGRRKEWIPPEERPRTPAEEKSDKPEIIKPGLTTVLGIATRISLAPVSNGRNSLFHALVHLPPFEGVRTLDEKVWYVESGYDYCVGYADSGRYGPGTTDLVLRYDNNAFHEGYIKVAHGIMEGLEARLVINTANLREGGEDIILTDFATSPETIYVASYDRRADIGNLIASIKWNFFRTISDWPEKDPESGFSGILDCKIPLCRNPKNFTSSGQFDIACSLSASYYFGRLLLFPFIGHMSAGVTVPLGERYFSSDVDLDPVFLFAIGADLKFAGWGVLAAHIEGNTSAFTEFDPLKGMVLSTHVGLRLMLGHFFAESSFGFPLSGNASKFVFTLHFGLHFMGKEREEEIVT